MMVKSLIHPNRCDNGCSLFDDRRDEHLHLGIGFCKVHGGETIISEGQYRFLSFRGCCSYGCSDL